MIVQTRKVLKRIRVVRGAIKMAMELQIILISVLILKVLLLTKVVRIQIPIKMVF